MTRLGQIHDRTSRGLFLLAGAALVTALALHVFEVVARYFFGAPTTWSEEAVQYALSVVIFGALPEITRRNGHIAIDVVPEMLTGASARWLGRFNVAIAAAACAISAWIAASEAQIQFEQGLLTNAANPIPRWWITTFIAVGLCSAAIHFLRQMWRTP